MIGYDKFRDKIVFKGCNPLTGVPVEIYFNESERFRARILFWNNLMHCWMLSKDAGLTWEKVTIEMMIEQDLFPFDKVIESVDLVL